MTTFAINSITEIGRLTKEPELRALPEGHCVCKLRLAVDGMGQSGATGYVDVDIFGEYGEKCAEHLTKGRQIGLKGRLQWREWENGAGERRQAHHIVAETVQFLGSERSQTDSSSDQAPAVPVAA